MSYFRELPNLEYQSFLSSRKGSDDYLLVKNIFRRVKLRDDLQNVFTIFNKYQIQEGARPDTVAEELYGSSQYDWVVLVGAGIVNVRNEWPLSDRDIYRYSEELYGNDLNDVHHYETKEIKDSRGRLILPAGKVVDSNFRIPDVDAYGNIGIGSAFYTSGWILGSQGSNAYTFTGPGFVGNESNPPLYLIKGERYTFTNNMNAHPFRIQTAPGTNGNIVSDGETISSVYSNGIVNNGVFNGTLTWDVQYNTPSVLYYQCTSHTAMVGEIYVITANINPVVGISNYEYEVRKNNKKRDIYVLKPAYLQQVINDTRKAMTYDRSSQYVNDKLIRTENTRVTMP